MAAAASTGVAKPPNRATKATTGSDSSHLASHNAERASRHENSGRASVRLGLRQTPQAIVEDIENLQFSFDLFDFTTNDDTANQPTTNSPSQIRSVTVSLTGRSPKVLNRSNKYYRFSLVSKVNVRNATFRNRYAGT